jgi:hypothetical protein
LQLQGLFTSQPELRTGFKTAPLKKSVTQRAGSNLVGF